MKFFLSTVAIFAALSYLPSAQATDICAGDLSVDGVNTVAETCLRDVPVFPFLVFEIDSTSPFAVYGVYGETSDIGGYLGGVMFGPYPTREAACIDEDPQLFVDADFDHGKSPSDPIRVVAAGKGFYVVKLSYSAAAGFAGTCLENPVEISILSSGNSRASKGAKNKSSKSTKSPKATR